MHAVISLLLQSRKFWWYLSLSSMLLHDVIMTSYCCQRYAECLVTTLFQQDSAQAHRAAHVQQYSWTAAPRNAKHSCTPPVASKQTRIGPKDYEIWAVMQHRIYHRQIHSVDEVKRRFIDVWCRLEQLIFDETIDQWRGRHRACVHAKGGHFEYSLWTDNDDFVHICYIWCDLFDCYIWGLRNHTSNVGQYILAHFTRLCTSWFEVWC